MIPHSKTLAKLIEGLEKQEASTSMVDKQLRDVMLEGRKTIVVRPMTKTEQQVALLLSPDHVTYLPGSWGKRFARALAYQAKNDDPCITEKQAEWLRKLAHKYRRQAPNAKLLLDMEAAGK